MSRGSVRIRSLTPVAPQSNKIVYMPSVIKSYSVRNAILFVALLLTPCPHALSEEEPQIGDRLRVIGGNLTKLAGSGTKDSVFVGWIAKGNSPYILRWKRPSIEPKPAKETPVSSDTVIKVAVDSLHAQLPEGLRPKMENLLGIGRYLVTDSISESFWIWVVEFKIDDEPIFSGNGLRKTLIVPISTDGILLLGVEKSTYKALGVKGQEGTGSGDMKADKHSVPERSK